MKQAGIVCGLLLTQLMQSVYAACTYGYAPEFALQMNNPSTLLASPYHTNIQIIDPQNKGNIGKATSVLIDTGSTGIVIGKSAVPASLFNNKQAKIEPFYYSSSGDYLIGKSVTAQVQFQGTLGGKQTELQTSPIPVLAAACGCKAVAGAATNKKTPNLDQCSSFNNTAADIGGNTGSHYLNQCHAVNPGMMGVGFDRGGKPATNNPFLQIPAITHKGYVITDHGITLGINAETAAKFVTVQLQQATPDATVSAFDWLAPNACVQVFQDGGQDKAQKLCGGLLVDTGIDYMFLGFPAAQIPTGSEVRTTVKFDGSLRNVVANGWQVGFSAANAEQKTMLAYVLNAAVPTKPKPEIPVGATVAVWVAPPSSNTGFINTGRRLLYAGNVMFDAQCGLYGFQQRTPPM